MRSRLVWAGLLVVAAVAYLAYTSWHGATLYYLTPSEAQGQMASLSGRPFRLAGKVAPGSVHWNPATTELEFRVTDGTASVPVVYKGAAPDNFGPDQQVVAEGVADGRGGMTASRLIIKCPSKYEQGSASSTQPQTRNLAIGGAAVLVAVVLVAVAGRYLGRAGGRSGRGGGRA